MIFHKHNWDLIDKTFIPGKQFVDFNAKGSAVPLMMDMMRDRVVLTFKCSCGKVRIEER